MAEQHGDLNAERQALLEVLQRHRVDGVVIGGVAIQTHGSDYRTNDIDLSPSPQAANLTRLARALNELQPALVIERQGPARSTIPLPAGYFTARSLGNQQFWNLATRHGDIDICFEPAGFPHGYDDLRPQATVQAIAGTTIALPVASLADVEHSKRTADRPKDRAYFQHHQPPTQSDQRDQLDGLGSASFPQDPKPDRDALAPWHGSTKGYSQTRGVQRDERDEPGR